MINANFVYVAIVVASISNVLYAYAMVRGEVRPNRMTWILWGLIPLITFGAELSEGVGVRSLLTLSAGVGPFVIVLLSFTVADAYWKTTRLDLLCASVSILALAVWAITRHGAIAIVFALAADLMAAIPTLRKAYRDPRSEHALAYVLIVVSGVITMLTISDWYFANYAFPLYITLMCGGIAAIIELRRRVVPV
jgi:hypothetical protein